MKNVKIETHSYDVIQNGTFNSEHFTATVKTYEYLELLAPEIASFQKEYYKLFDDEMEISFHWSDNNGLNINCCEEALIPLLEKYSKEGLELYLSFCDRNDKYRQYCDDMYDEDGFNNLTAQGF
jgi:hypothetical protein